MIASLRGKVLAREPGRLVIEVNGLGYEVFVPLGTYNSTPPRGESVSLEIRHLVREDAHVLYGFASGAEKAAFDLLMRVQQIGPKLALAILSIVTPEELVTAIQREDVARLHAVPGVGPKVAERIVRELRDKIDGLRNMLKERDGDHEPPTRPNAVVDDAVSALVNLGYKPTEARRAVEVAMEGSKESDNDLEAIIRTALSLILGER